MWTVMIENSFGYSERVGEFSSEEAATLCAVSWINSIGYDNVWILPPLENPNAQL